jgi:hypothetical protein
MPKRTPQPGDADFNWDTYDSFRAENDPLKDAQETLYNAKLFGAKNNTIRLAAAPESLAALKAQGDHRGTTRQITEGLSTVGGNVALAGLPASYINPIVGGAMMTGGGLATLPNYLRKEFSPEEDEAPADNWDRGFAALAALPGVNSLKGLKSAKTLAPELEGALGDLRGFAQREAVMGKSAAPAMSPTQQGMLDDIAAFRKGGGGKSLEGLQDVTTSTPELPASWKGLPSDADVAAENATRAADRLARPSRARTPDLMDEFQASTSGPAPEFEMGGTRYAADASGSHKAVTSSPMDDFYAANPGARTGGEGRTTGTWKEGSGGLSDLAAGKIKPHAMPDTPAERVAKLSRQPAASRKPVRPPSDVYLDELLKKFGGTGR